MLAFKLAGRVLPKPAALSDQTYRCQDKQQKKSVVRAGGYAAFIGFLFRRYIEDIIQTIGIYEIRLALAEASAGILSNVLRYNGHFLPID